MKKIEVIFLSLLLLVALFLRVAYLDWGAYGKEIEINNEKYILKDLVPDEGDELSLANNIYEHKNPFLMQYFTTGPLYPYLILLSSGFYSLFFPITPGFVWLLIRLVNILISLASIFVLYKIGKFFNNRTAVISSLFLAFSPLAVREAKWISSYSLLLLLSCLIILYALKAYKTEQKKDLFLLGLFIGLAILTKYIAAVFLIIPLTVYPRKRNFKNLLYIALPIFISCIFLLFLAIYNLQSFEHFLDLQKEWGRHNLTNTPSYSFNLFPASLTTPIFILSLFGLLFWLKKKETQSLFLTILALYLALELSNLKAARFVLIFLPFFYLSAATMLDYFYKKRLKFLILLLFFLIILNALFYSLATIDLFDINKEPRIQTLKWVYTLPENTEVGLYSPYSEGKLEPLYKIKGYNLVNYSAKPRYIIVPSTTVSLWKNYFNLKSKGIEANWLPYKIPNEQEIALFDAIVNEKEYSVFKSFKNDVKFLFDYNNYDDPNDFINREVVVYERKD